MAKEHLAIPSEDVELPFYNIISHNIDIATEILSWADFGRCLYSKTALLIYNFIFALVVAILVTQIDFENPQGAPAFSISFWCASHANVERLALLQRLAALR